MDVYYKFIDVLNIASILASIIGAVGALTFFGLTRIKFGALELQLDRAIKQPKEALPLNGSSSSSSTPTSLGQHQYALLQEYHAQGLAQSKISFWFSLIFAAVGFSVIIFSIGLYLRQDTIVGETAVSSLQKPGFSLVAGTVIEAVSALFFVQSNRARQLMTEFFDRLRVDRKLDESLRLSEAITDSKVKAALMAVLALSFADVRPDAILHQILGSPNPGVDPSPDSRASNSKDSEQSP